MGGSAGKEGSVVAVESITDERVVREFFRTMLVGNFAPDELLSVDALVAGVKAGSKQLLAGFTPDGTIVAGAVGDWFAGSRVQLLSYLVVAPELRGKGAGTLALRAALSEWTTEFDPLLIVGEVEDPRYFQDVGLGDPVARVRFYERLGVRSLPLPYAQPALSAQSSRVPHLILMAFATHDQARHVSGNVDGRIVEQFLTEYFESAEGPLRPDDAEFNAMRAACRASEGLPLLLADELPAY